MTTDTPVVPRITYKHVANVEDDFEQWRDAVLVIRPDQSIVEHIRYYMEKSRV